MRIIVFIMMAFALALPAQAQSKKELAAQNMALTERLARLESRMLTGDPAAERLMQRVDALEASQRTLTGEVERLRFERDNLRAELSAMNETVLELEALSARTILHLDAVDLVATQGPQPGSSPSFPSQTFPSQSFPSQPQGNTPYIYDGAPNAGGSNLGVQTVEPPLAGSPNQLNSVPNAPVFKEMTIPVQQDFERLALLPAAGKTKLAEGNFAGAQIDFRDYLNAMPDAPDAGEVSFWLGETYYVRQAYADAADAYIASMRKAPNGVKAPDAMVSLAAALRGLGKQTEACQALDSFPSQYPNAPANVREKARTERLRTGC